LDPASIESGETYRSFLLTNDRCPPELRSVTLDTGSLTSVDLAASRWDQAFWTDLRLDGCELSNARWHRSAVRRVQILNTRLVGFSLGEEGKLEDVLFSGCNLELASFRFARFKNVRFERCRLREADFQGVDLSSTAFEACDLHSAELSGARLAGVDLRGNQIDGMRAGPAELRGAIIEPVQAVAVAEGLGITVEWTDEAPDVAP
jgi:uncharacterized protein YjbI with pentapeptide repeats